MKKTDLLLLGGAALFLLKGAKAQPQSSASPLRLVGSGGSAKVGEVLISPPTSPLPKLVVETGKFSPPQEYVPPHSLTSLQQKILSQVQRFAHVTLTKKQQLGIVESIERIGKREGWEKAFSVYDIPVPKELW